MWPKAKRARAVETLTIDTLGDQIERKKKVSKLSFKMYMQNEQRQTFGNAQNYI